MEKESDSWKLRKWAEKNKILQIEKGAQKESNYRIQEK